MRASAHGTIPERELNQQACAVMVASEQSVGEIVDGLTRVATRHLQRRRALEIGVKAVVQACPVFIGDLRKAIVAAAARPEAGTAGAPRVYRGHAPRHRPRHPRALALPAAASAKEVGALTVCGSDGCKKITAHAALRGFMDGGYETLAPGAAGPFFTVKVAMRHEGEDAGGWTVEYLRAANLIRATTDYSKHVWTRPAGVTAQALHRAARGLQPYPAEKLGPVREPSPVAVEDPPARVSRPASGGGSLRLGLAGGGAGAALLLAAGVLLARRRRQRPG